MYKKHFDMIFTEKTKRIVIFIHILKLKYVVNISFLYFTMHKMAESRLFNFKVSVF